MDIMKEKWRGRVAKSLDADEFERSSLTNDYDALPSLKWLFWRPSSAVTVHYLMRGGVGGGGKGAEQSKLN